MKRGTNHEKHENKGSPLHWYCKRGSLVFSENDCNTFADLKGKSC